MSTITDWLMVIITLVYVIATIFICFFNYKSAKATREQVAEARRQYEETNRAYITYEFIYVKRAFYGVKFTNYGKKVAENIHLEFSQEFIDSLTEKRFADLLEEQKEKVFILGIGQSYEIYFGSNKYLDNSKKTPLEGIIVYEDDKETYSTPFYIDTRNYATIYSINSEKDDLISEIKKQNIELKGIKEKI